MVILEIDGQKYAGPSYITGTENEAEQAALVQKLAEELAETVLLHYGYTGIAWVVTNLSKKEDENDH